MEKDLKKYLTGGKFTNVSMSRSRTMSTIKGKNNRSTEICLKMEMVRRGISGWKLHANALPGKPDFCFPLEKLVIFVDGCYWHGCSKCGHVPKTRTDFWRAKINKNKERDKANTLKLKKAGFHSIRIWEHELKGKESMRVVVEKITDKLKST